MSSILRSEAGQLSLNAASQLKHLRASVKMFLESIRTTPKATCHNPLKADVTKASRTRTSYTRVTSQGECCAKCEEDVECNSWLYDDKPTSLGATMCYHLASFGALDYTMPEGARLIGCSSKSTTCTIGVTPVDEDSPSSGVALVQAQVSALNTMATAVAQLPKAGFVPTFTRQIYETRLDEYMVRIQGFLLKTRPPCPFSALSLHCLLLTSPL